MSQCNLGEPWRVQMNADIAAAAAQHPEIEVVFQDAQNDASRQRSQIEEFAAAGVDLLIVSPMEPEPLTGPISEVYQQGIPVIVLDRAVYGEDYTCFIGADNVKIAEAVGEFVLEILGGEGQVVELTGRMTDMPGRDRHIGFHNVIDGTGVEVIFQADTIWLEPNARSEMESALSRFEDIDLVYGHNDPAARGAHLAARAADRDDEMLFLGIDALPHEGQAYVREGIFAATFLYPTGGAEAIDIALRILNGEEVPKEIVLNSRVFTPDNIDQGGEVLIFTEE
ncbi:substrate-binding domain-containing protein [Candidatus Sumerlaeota bacterium]|nr:substrate-binding domain-containing protein [Candidatus Sumerlaeota bacterium]